MDEWDAYFWPNSTVLKNKLGLTNEAALRAFEYEATRQRSEQLAREPIQGTFDTAHFRAIHRHLFQNVYAWAGEYRTVEFSKGRSQRPLTTLGSWGDKILKDLATENHLKGHGKERFVDRLTHHYGEINHWHPMREGNGRAAKEFLSQLAKQAGYQLEYERVSDTDWNSAAAAQESAGDSRLAREAFSKIVVPSRAIAFRDEPIRDAARRFPELHGAADALEAARQKAAVDFDPRTQQIFLATVQTKLFDRLSAGEIVYTRSVDRPAKDDPFVR